MKRFVALVLLMLYAVSIVGLSAQVHVCGGHITSLSINAENRGDKCCCDSDDSCSEDSDEGDCCHSTTISTKAPDSHQVSTHIQIPDTKLIISYSVLLPTSYYIEHSNSRSSFADYSHAPPDHCSLKSPRFLQLRILLI